MARCTKESTICREPSSIATRNALVGSVLHVTGRALAPRARSASTSSGSSATTAAARRLADRSATLVGSAPAARSAAQTSRWPAVAAAARGVSSLSVTASTVAPQASKRDTASGAPRRAAATRAVSPDKAHQSTGQFPASASRAHSSKSPSSIASAIASICAAARSWFRSRAISRGVRPFESSNVASAPWRSSAPMAAPAPAAAAACSDVAP
mmetsp:Transcript_24754/g.69620  ORF Transcript_24754/g.69620 Transcript_24754/m.69620 type:complete len:212 (+) Transcript_24754:1323-1958(+)